MIISLILGNQVLSLTCTEKHMLVWDRRHSRIIFNKLIYILFYFAFKIRSVSMEAKLTDQID